MESAIVTTPSIIKPSPTIILSPTPNGNNESSIPNLADLQKYMLDLINDARHSQGLGPVIWDEFATQIGQAHAEEMAMHQYMSHWNMQGFGPDVRYSLAGGSEWVQENVFSSWNRYDNGTPVPITDWKAQVLQAHESLMNSPGHRANIMNPDHTHVGVGIAYNPATGEFRVAEEFINRYIALDQLPGSAQPSETIAVSGSMLNGATDPLVNLAYEPVPTSMTVEQLNSTHSYASPAQIIGAIPLQQQDGNTFKAQVNLGDQPGLYHIRIFVKANGADLQAVDWIIWVGATANSSDVVTPNSVSSQSSGYINADGEYGFNFPTDWQGQETGTDVRFRIDGVKIDITVQPATESETIYNLQNTAGPLPAQAQFADVMVGGVHALREDLLNDNGQLTGRAYHVFNRGYRYLLLIVTDTDTLPPDFDDLLAHFEELVQSFRFITSDM